MAQMVPKISSELIIPLSRIIKYSYCHCSPPTTLVAVWIVDFADMENIVYNACPEKICNNRKLKKEEGDDVLKCKNCGKSSDGSHKAYRIVVLFALNIPMKNHSIYRINIKYHVNVLLFNRQKLLILSLIRR